MISIFKEHLFSDGSVFVDNNKVLPGKYTKFGVLFSNSANGPTIYTRTQLYRTGVPEKEERRKKEIWLPSDPHSRSGSYSGALSVVSPLLYSV